jgi:DNA-binding NarL/FixJ family response regulator
MRLSAQTGKPVADPGAAAPPMGAERARLRGTRRSSSSATLAGDGRRPISETTIIVTEPAAGPNTPRAMLLTLNAKPEALPPPVKAPSCDMLLSGAGGDVGANAGETERVAEPTRYRLVIADDHPLFRGALREAVSGLFEEVEIAEAGSFDDVAALLERGGEVDLILLDLTMPGVRGFSGLMYLRAQYPSVPIVVVSANDDPAVIRRCVDFGASGFIPKTLGIEAIRGAIARVLEGGAWMPPDIDLGAGSDAETADLMARLASLTPQQVRVLMMLSEGLLNKQIAYELTVSEATVKAHVSAILQKLGVESRTQAVIAASKIELGQWPQTSGVGH